MVFSVPQGMHVAVCSLACHDQWLVSLIIWQCWGCHRSGQLQSADHVFMRWKEQCFVNASEDCGLTIAGFYYVCLSRQTGDVEGVMPAPEDPHTKVFAIYLAAVLLPC